RPCAVHPALERGQAAERRGRAAARAHPGLRDERAQDGIPDRVRHLHSIPHHRYAGGQRAHVHGHDDGVARHHLPAVQDHAVRAGGRVEPADRLPRAELLHMTPDMVMTIGRQALETTLLVSAPLLLAALVVGLIVSLFQAATQINEMTLSFIPKLIAVFVAMIFAGPWMLTMLVEYMRRLFSSIPGLVG